MKVLLTGGAGFIGSHLVQGMRNCGYEVIIVDNFSSGKRNFCHLMFVSMKWTSADSLSPCRSDERFGLRARSNAGRLKQYSGKFTVLS